MENGNSYKNEYIMDIDIHWKSENWVTINENYRNRKFSNDLINWQPDSSVTKKGKYFDLNVMINWLGHVRPDNLLKTWCQITFYEMKKKKPCSVSDFSLY